MPRQPGTRNHYRRGNHATPRDITPFKDKIIELAGLHTTNKRKRAKKIKEYLLAVENIDCSANTVRSLLVEWGIEEAPQRRSIERPKLSRPTQLLPFKEDILQWNRAGLDASQIRAQIQQRFKKDVRVTNIRNSLAIWSPNSDDGIALPASWREIESQPRENEFPSVPFLPVDVLTDEEVETLRKAVQELYLQEPLCQSDPTRDWPQHIANALCLDEIVQGIIVKEKLKPGCFWDLKRQLNPIWVLGIHLPGSYQYETIDTESKILSVVNNLTPAILRITYSRLSDWLDQAMADALQRFTDDCFIPALALRPVTTPATCITKLLDDARDEITVTRLDVGLKKVLGRLPLNNLNLPGCEELLHYLEDDLDEPSILDSFTTDVIKRLDRSGQARIVLAELPQLTEDHMAALLKEPDTMANFQRVANEKIGSDTGQRAEVGRMYTTLLKYTRKRIQPQPLVFCKWNCPTSGPLIGHPPPRFDEVDWDLADGLGQMDIAANGAGGSLGHVTPRTPVNKTHNYRRCIQYLDLLLETQNPEEKDDYEAIVNRMAACNSRTFQKHGSMAPWSTNIRDDDWWHIRRIVQMLVQRYTLERDVCRIFEQRMMMVLAAIEGGFTEAVLWLVPLEGLLKEFSQYIARRNKIFGQLSETELAIQQELLRELLTFSHGLALTNLTLRFHAKDPRSSTKSYLPKNMLLVWYTMVYQVTQACHLRSCHCPMPNPRHISDTTLWGTDLSVGTNDPRTGSSRARSFISSDRGRGGIYPCLITWFLYRDADPALLMAFLWFGGIFHSRACKACRGKWKENF
jgi:hypothetical protein